MANQRFAGRDEGKVWSDEEEYERGLFQEFVGAFDRFSRVDGRQKGGGRDADAREGVSVDEERGSDAREFNPSERGIETVLRGLPRFLFVGVKGEVGSFGGRGGEERSDERGGTDDVAPCRGGERGAAKGTGRVFFGLSVSRGVLSG